MATQTISLSKHYFQILGELESQEIKYKQKAVNSTRGNERLEHEKMVQVTRRQIDQLKADKRKAATNLTP